MSKIKYENIGVENDGDIIFITISKYKLFLSYGKVGIDAMTLYLHLMFTARLQATNKVWASNYYVRQGLKWSKERLLKAKNLLSDLDLISQEQKKDDAGKFQKTYITVKTKTTTLEFGENITGGLKTGHRITRLPENDHKCLNEKEKCLNYKLKYIHVLEIWNKQSLQKHAEKTFENRIEAKHVRTIKLYDIETIEQAFFNYSTVVNSDKYFFNYRWDMFEFLERGIHKFIDDASPLQNFLKKDIEPAQPPKLVPYTEEKLEELRQFNERIKGRI